MRAARHAWLAPILAFLLTLPFVTTRIYASDEVQYFAYLRSLWFDRDVSFENEYRHFYETGVTRNAAFHETFLERTTEAGRRINFATIGCALLWSPFYAAADAATRVRQGSPGAPPPDGFSQPYITAVAWASAFYGWLGLALAVAAVRRLAGPRAGTTRRAAIAAAVALAGTPLVFYMFVAPPMSHATSAFTVALVLYTWLRVRERWTAAGCVALGLAGALAAMVREQDAFVLAGPAVDALWRLARAGTARERLRLAGVFMAGLGACALAYLPQAAAYLALNGHVGPSRLVARKMSWTSPHAFEVLASPAHGFFVWTPLAAVGLAGLWWLPRLAAGRDGRRIAGVLGLVAALQVYVAGSVESWTVAGAFGQRRFVALTAVLVIGWAALLHAVAPGWRRALALLLAASTWWNISLMAQFGAGLMDRQRLEPARIAYNTFVVVPRLLPTLAWRYVFDRPSFYEQRKRLGQEAAGSGS